jgi:DNA-binding LacI/PurR family transcriptional regulator
MSAGFSNDDADRSLAEYLTGKGYRGFDFVGGDWKIDHRVRQGYTGFALRLRENGLQENKYANTRLLARRIE